MSQVQVIKYQTGAKKKSNVPITEDWKGVKMIRAHSIIATAKEVLGHNRFFQATRVGIVGNMGTGKTTLAMTLAHLLHKEADVPFAIRVFDEEALLNFRETISNLEPANYIIIIDDASFLSAQASKLKMDGIKQDITKIRHFPNQVDKRIIMIINWHYEYGLDKMIRSTDFRYCTSVGISDTDNLAKLTGSRYLQMIMQFQQMCVLMAKTPFEFRFMLGKMAFIYNYRKPHIPLLFYNKHTLRFVVSPKRQFVDPICTLCSNAENKIMQSDIDINQFLKKLDVEYGLGSVKMAIRAKLLSNGINVFPPRAKRCMRAIDAYFAHKIIDLEELAKTWKLKDEKTHLYNKIDCDEDLTIQKPLVKKIVLKPIEQTAIELVQSIQMIQSIQPIQTIQPKNGYSEYESMNYEQIVAELENMLKIPPDEVDREKYEYLNDKARGLIEIADSNNSQ